MVTLYADGKPIPWADAPRLVPEHLARNQRVELRDDAGVQIGVIAPTPPADPAEPPVPWEPNLTREEIDRRLAEPGPDLRRRQETAGLGMIRCRPRACSRPEA